MHTVPLAARRMIYGRLVVHGMHLVLWALDTLIAHTGQFSIKSIKTRFHSPVFEGETIVLDHQKDGDKHIIFLLSNQKLKAKIDVITSAPLPTTKPLRQESPTVTCQALTAESILDAKGCFPICHNKETSQRLFPKLTDCLDQNQLASLSALSQLVGMHCPGLNSIFSSFEATAGAAEDNNAHYELTRFDERFTFAQIAFSFPNLSGSLQAFLRPDQVQQPSCRDLAKLVKNREFSHLHALVVGGSRGIGEVTAKLLAAGGADVHLTYSRGKKDAEQVCQEISATGGKCSSFRYDALDADSTPVNFDGEWSPNAIFYYPTPPIFQGNSDSFSPDLFKQFNDFYVNGFLTLLERLPEQDMTILYPSSVAVDEIPQDMGEYASAKAAGETMCAFLSATKKHLTIHCPRLPRLHTDQTVSLSPVKNNAPVEIMLPLLRTHFNSQ